MDFTSRVFARPGAPVMRQWPPESSAIMICSMTACRPTMSFSAVSRSAAKTLATLVGGTVEGGVLMGFSAMRSVRHQVKDDVDAKWVGNLFGKRVEIVAILALALPPVTHVAVVDHDDHDSLLVVEPGAEMHVVRALAAINPRKVR